MITLPRRLTALVAVAVLAGPNAACGTTCDQIRADREAFLSQHASADEPHVVVAIPFALANRIVAERFATPAPVRLRLPGLGPVGRFFDGVSLVPRSIALRPARRDHVGVRIVVAIRVGREEAATLTLDGEAQPVLDAARGRLDLVFHADDLRGVRPALGADAKERIAAAVWRLLPPPARAVLSRDAIGGVASKVTEEAVARSWELLRDGPLASLGEVTRISVALPDLPIARLALRSVGDDRRGHLEIAVTTTLPVSHGLPEKLPALRPRPDHVAVRLSGGAAAALGNHAIALGLIPDRYDHDGNAVVGGPFEAGLGWEPGARPLKVLLWQLEAPCISARLGGTLQARVEGSDVALDFVDGVVEEVRGPPVIEVGAWFYGLAADALSFSVRTAADLRVAVAGVTLTPRLHAVRVAGDSVTIDLAVPAAP